MDDIRLEKQFIISFQTAEGKCAFSQFYFLPNHKMPGFLAQLEYSQLPATEFGGL